MFDFTNYSNLDAFYMIDYLMQPVEIGSIPTGPDAGLTGQQLNCHTESFHSHSFSPHGEGPLPQASYRRGGGRRQEQREGLRDFL